MQLEEVFDGFKNLIIKDKAIEKLAKERLSVCLLCDKRTNNFCKRQRSMER